MTSRNVKIVATLGPSSSSSEILEQLVKAGLDVARMNFSHGTHENHKAQIEKIREISRKFKKPVAILQDLQGPKLRVGKMPEGGTQLVGGTHVTFSKNGDVPGSIPIKEDIAWAFFKDLKPGSLILLDDGKMKLQVIKLEPGKSLEATVEVGGHLTSNKGINLPGTPLSLPSVTDKDLLDLEFGLANEVDAIALSFVRSAKDVEQVRDMIRERIKAGTVKRMPLLVSKIEREEAVADLESILEVSDGVLIARGDMAVELGAERVPVIQKRMIQMCNKMGIPVITATQMLESMISCPTPTRAEANDVANAVFDGTDAVMLSAETASGQYPVVAVETMARIIREAEAHYEDLAMSIDQPPIRGSIVDAIEYSAAEIADVVGAKLIACLTHTGMAAKTLAKYRPSVPIIAVMDREDVLRRMSFVWGVQGVLIPEILATDDLISMFETVLTQANLAQDGDLVLLTAGIPSLSRGSTNMVKVHRIGSDPSRELQ